MLDKERVLLTKETEMGLVQVFTGNGKGKTTAALGTVMRSLGHGLRVCIIFFMKGNYDYGEYSTLSRLNNIDMSSYGTRKLTDPANIKPEEKEQAEMALDAARRALLAEKYDLVVLDEVNVASSFGLIEADEVIKLIEDKPLDVELILTGRNADDRIIGMADLVTEMVEVKHPFNMGIKARKGIEY
jgi:cob(I)alamin adenosyltransferase